MPMDQTLAQQGFYQPNKGPMPYQPGTAEWYRMTGNASGPRLPAIPAATPGTWSAPGPLTPSQMRDIQQNNIDQQRQMQQYRQQPNPMMGFNPLMGGYMGGMPSQFGGTGRFDGSQMPQFAGPDPAMGGYPWNMGRPMQQAPSQGYGNIAALFSQFFGGGGMGGYGGGYPAQGGGYGGSMFGTGSFGGQGGSPFNSYNPFGNMMGSSGPNPLMGGFSSGGGGYQRQGQYAPPAIGYTPPASGYMPGNDAIAMGGGMFGGQGFGQGFGQGYGGGYNVGQNPFGYSPQQLQAGQNPNLYTPQGMR